MDLSTQTIKKIFEQQVQELTKRTAARKEELIDYQLSGGWLR